MYTKVNNEEVPLLKITVCIPAAFGQFLAARCLSRITPDRRGICSIVLPQTPDMLKTL